MRRLRFFRLLLVFTLLAPRLASAQTTQTATPWCMRQRVVLFNNVGFVSQTPDVARDSGAFDVSADGASGRRGLISYRGVYYHAFFDGSSGSSDIYFRRSRDGMTWSPKVRISVDSSVATEQFWPMLVAWGGGATPVKLAVAYRDNRRPDRPEAWLTRSTNAGQTWMPARRMFGGEFDEVVPDLAVSPEDSLYLSVSTALATGWRGMHFSSSTNGGQTWRPWRNVYSGGLQYTRLAQLETGPGGHVWMSASEDQFQHNNIRVVHSADYGRTWDAGVNGTPYTAFQDIINSYPTSLVVRRLPNGHLLALYHYLFPPGPPFRLAQYVVRSTDNGATWGQPVRVDDDVATKGRSFSFLNSLPGTMAVTPNGTIYAVYADDRRQSGLPGQPLDSTRFDVYLTRSTDEGQTWAPGRRVNQRQGLHLHAQPALAVKRNGTTDSVLVTWINMRFVPAPTGITEEAGRAPLTVWPNPAHERAYVAAAPAGPSAQPAAVVLLDGLGRVVRRQSRGAENPMPFDLRGLTPGFYTLRVGERTARLVVE